MRFVLFGIVEKKKNLYLITPTQIITDNLPQKKFSLGKSIKKEGGKTPSSSKIKKRIEE